MTPAEVSRFLTKWAPPAARAAAPLALWRSFR